MVFVLVILIVVILVVAVIAGISKENRQKELQEERKSALELAKQESQIAYNAKLDELKKQYGEISVDVITNTFQERNIEKHIYVFEKSEILYVNNEPIAFDKILSCELKDNQSTITKTIPAKYKTSTNTGSMVGRAIVGGILTGGVGAVVGAVTAKKNN